jgi:uncharacterized membrane protein
LEVEAVRFDFFIVRHASIAKTYLLLHGRVSRILLILVVLNGHVRVKGVLESRREELVELLDHGVDVLSAALLDLVVTLAASLLAALVAKKSLDALGRGHGASSQHTTHSVALVNLPLKRSRAVRTGAKWRQRVHPARRAAGRTPKACPEVRAGDGDAVLLLKGIVG